MKTRALNERVIVRREVAKEENEFTKKIVSDNLGLLISIAPDCKVYLEDAILKEVMFAPGASESLGFEEGFEYLLMHQSAVLCY